MVIRANEVDSSIIDDFITNVVTPALNKVQGQLAFKKHPANAYFIAEFEAANKAAYHPNPKEYLPSPANFIGDRMSIKALTMLFLSYAHHLTSIRNVQLKINKTIVDTDFPQGGDPGNITGTRSRICSSSATYNLGSVTHRAIGTISIDASNGATSVVSLGARYRMTKASFMAGADPTLIDKLVTGSEATAANLNQLITNLRNVVLANTGTSTTTVNVATCHTSTINPAKADVTSCIATFRCNCHSSCHGSRGRR